jgi:uncharacterized protein (DUF342 family)
LKKKVAAFYHYRTQWSKDERDRMKKITLFLCIIVALFGCSKKEVKPESQESKVAQESFTLAETLKNAFIKGDHATLQENTTEEGYKDVTANKKAFGGVELTFSPRWVEIEDNQVTLNVSWKSAWFSEGKKTEDRGMAVFVMEGKPLKVTKILRSNPFKYPEQQP